jgi:hypothetical protein
MVTERVELTPLEKTKEDLTNFFEASHGMSWIRKDNWLTNAAFFRWYGVVVDKYGEPVGLYLKSNGIIGEKIR